MPREPNRCERCLTFWAPEAAPVALWHHRGFQVCTDRVGCDSRINWAVRFDHMIRTPAPGALRAQELVTVAPVVNLRPTAEPGGDGP